MTFSGLILDGPRAGEVVAVPHPRLEIAEACRQHLGGPYIGEASAPWEASFTPYHTRTLRYEEVALFGRLCGVWAERRPTDEAMARIFLSGVGLEAWKSGRPR